ncbi:MAG TPA: helix-turn-helix domain-containing protein [Candidatus Limnocylindria bacterium]|jgi:AcrR family transcriptional regulator
MTHLPNSETRSYRSRLRAEQAEETRRRILDAAMRVIAKGVLDISVPAIAREAGVSVATVYRHFRTKRDLVGAVYPHAMRSAGLREVAAPRTLDELHDSVVEYFGQLDGLDEVTRAAMASPASEQVRRLSMPVRTAAFVRLADSIEPRPSPADRDRIARLLMILTGSSAQRMWREHFGLTVDEAADDIDWIVRAAAAATREGAG